VGSRFDEWWFLLDFFFLADGVVVAAAVEVAGADAALDCCGVIAEAAGFAAEAKHAYTREARTSDAVIGSLLIFVCMSSLPRTAGFQKRSVRHGQLTLL
jgi:hypothetical protein